MWVQSGVVTKSAWRDPATGCRAPPRGRCSTVEGCTAPGATAAWAAADKMSSDGTRMPGSLHIRRILPLGGDADVREPQTAPAGALLAGCELLGRDGLLRPEAGSIAGARVHRGIGPPCVLIQHGGEHTAAGAEQEFRLAAALPVTCRLRRVLDADGESPRRVRDIGGGMLAAEIAVTGTRPIHRRCLAQGKLKPDIAAMAAAVECMHARLRWLLPGGDIQVPVFATTLGMPKARR